VNSSVASSISSRCENIVGSENVYTETAQLADYAIDEVSPTLAVRPADAAQAAGIVRLAVEEKLSLIPVGAHSTLSIGMPPTRYDLALDVSRLHGVAHYDPGDLTISVDAGTPLAELASILAQQNQFLPLAVPFFEQATVGGAIACGLDSPLRHFYGTARDFIIGAEFIDGTGAQTKSGGRVVKNVTGYDFHKLMIGSLGSLAILTRVNFRTFPLQPVRQAFLIPFPDEFAALTFTTRLIATALTPAIVEIISPAFAVLAAQENSPRASSHFHPQAWTVCVGFEGSENVCARYTRDLKALAQAAAAQNFVLLQDSQFAALLQLLREAPATMHRMSPQPVVFRFAALPAQLPDLLRSLKALTNAQRLSCITLIRSGFIIYLAVIPSESGEQSFGSVFALWQSIATLRAKFEFNPTILFCPPAWKAELNVWRYAADPLGLHARVKKAFDPSNTFAPGRFAGDMQTP
jgi:glycolate oxidase FAD binding subunit